MQPRNKLTGHYNIATSHSSMKTTSDSHLRNQLWLKEKLMDGSENILLNIDFKKIVKYYKMVILHFTSIRIFEK